MSETPTQQRTLGERYAGVLSALERFTRIDLRQHAKSWTWLMSGQAVGTATALLLAIGYSHFLSKETYGTYKYVLSIVGILGVLAMPGMDSAAQRSIARGQDGVFWQTFRKRLLGGGAATLVAAAIGLYYFSQGHTLLAAIFFAVAPFLIFFEPLGHYTSLLMGKQLFKQLTFYSVLLQTSAAAIIFATVVLTDNLLLIVLSYLATFTLIRAMILLRVVHTFPPNNVASEGEVAYGTHMTVINLLGIGSSNLDAILLWHFLGPVPLAIYSFAQAAADQARKAFKLVTTAIAFPKFASQDKELLKKTLGRKILLAHLATIPLAFLFVLIIPPVYRLVFPAYTESIIYAQVMAALLALSPMRFYSTAIAAHAGTKTLYTLGVTQSVLQTVLYLLMIPLFGIWGVILATTIQQFLSNILAFRLFKKL